MLRCYMCKTCRTPNMELKYIIFECPSHRMTKGIVLIDERTLFWIWTSFRFDSMSFKSVSYWLCQLMWWHSAKLFRVTTHKHSWQHVNMTVEFNWSTRRCGMYTSTRKTAFSVVSDENSVLFVCLHPYTSAAVTTNIFLVLWLSPAMKH